MSPSVTKLLSLLVYPLSLGLGLAVVGGVLGLGRGARGLGATLLVSGLLIVWIPSMPVFSWWLRGTLEHRFPPVPVEALPEADAIVVLGGGVTGPVAPRLHADLNAAADRVVHAARLHRAGKAPVLVASGGPLPWASRPTTDDEAAWQTWGVPPEAVVAEVRSTTTYENARYTAELAHERAWSHLLLVTSALHMRRALATFEATGLRVTPAATDYEIIDAVDYSLVSWLPEAKALYGSTRAIKEYVGYRVYAWRGWLDPPDETSRADDGTRSGRRGPSAQARASDPPEASPSDMGPRDGARASPSSGSRSGRLPSAGAVPPPPVPSGQAATWQPVTTLAGLDVHYVYYDEESNEGGGVVLGLHNRNAHAVRYRFDLVLRAGDGTEHVEPVAGRLAAGGFAVGSEAGLFFQPFGEAGRSLGTLGVRRARVAHVTERMSGRGMQDGGRLPR
jgi:uncharacterized SAM-binding protein YcdF (DUF218 family)